MSIYMEAPRNHDTYRTTNGNLYLRVIFYEQGQRNRWEVLPEFPAIISKTIKVVLFLRGKDSLVDIILSHDKKFREYSSAIALHVDVNSINNNEELAKYFQIVDINELPNVLQYKHKEDCSEFTFYLDYQPNINQEQDYSFAIKIYDKTICEYPFTLASK